MLFNRKLNPEKIKVKNQRLLKSEGLHVIDHLPILDKPQFRSNKEIAERALVLMAIFQLSLEAPRDIITTWLQENNLYNSLTEEECEYLEADFNDLTEQNQANIYWSIEALWAFVWVGKHHNALTLNTPVEDSLATMLPNIANNESAKPFLQSFKARKDSETFEMLDKLYRAHWFARQKHLNNEPTDLVDLDIIMERRKTLEFCCYSDIPWNEISLDT